MTSIDQLRMKELVEGIGARSDVVIRPARPRATVVIGGLATSTLLALVVSPALYAAALSRRS